MAAKPLGFNESTVFVVETNYPKDRQENLNFSTYNASSYTNVDDPGSSYDKMLVNTHKEIFGKRISHDSLRFATLEDAQAAATFLDTYGRLTQGWNNEYGLERAKQYRGKLSVRIVEEYTSINRVIRDFTPIDMYEIELAKLKEKYGRV